MREGPDIARIGALIGDPARAAILSALACGKALTATELAAEAGVTKQTASAHLAKLEEGGLLARRVQGRHRYFALAGEDVGLALEALMGLAATRGHLRTRTGPRDAALRHARVCYRHLAGEMGIRLYEGLVARGCLTLTCDAIGLSEAGARHLAAFGLEVERLDAGRAPLCRPCLDWSERRTHLGGALGRALFAALEARGWMQRERSSRLVTVTAAGRRGFSQWFEAPA